MHVELTHARIGEMAPSLIIGRVTCLRYPKLFNPFQRRPRPPLALIHSDQFCISSFYSEIGSAYRNAPIVYLMRSQTNYNVSEATYVALGWLNFEVQKKVLHDLAYEEEQDARSDAMPSGS